MRLLASWDCPSRTVKLMYIVIYVNIDIFIFIYYIHDDDDSIRRFLLIKISWRPLRLKERPLLAYDLWSLSYASIF